MTREHRAILNMIASNCVVCERAGASLPPYEIARIRLYLEKILRETENETGIPE